MSTAIEPDQIRLSSQKAMADNAAAMLENCGRYYSWSLRQFPLERQRRLLDLGCGPGTFFQAIMASDPARYVGVDYSQAYLDRLKELIADRPHCETRLLDLLDTQALEMFKGEVFDDVICFDVLEHIEDDSAALTNIRRIMQSTGASRLFLKVPAIQAIFGRNDLAIGHFRRYSKHTLVRLAVLCGFNVVSIKYQNFPGILPWFIIGRLLKRGLAASDTESRAFDLAVPVIERLEKICPPPIGLSLCATVSIGRQGAGKTSGTKSP